MKKFLLLMVVCVMAISLISTGCKNDSARIKELDERISNLQNQLLEKENKIKQLESNISTTTVEITVPQTTIAEKTASVTTIKEVTTTTIREENAEDNFKKVYTDFIENTFGGKVTKFVISDNLLNITVSYSTQWSGADAVKKEMFDITTTFTVGENPPSFDLELSAATQLGDTYYSVTNKENLSKIRNLEMDYADWLKVAFK